MSAPAFTWESGAEGVNLISLAILSLPQAFHGWCRSKLWAAQRWGWLSPGMGCPRRCWMSEEGEYLGIFDSFCIFSSLWPPKILLSRKQLPWKWVILANPSVNSFWAVAYDTDNLQRLLYKTVTVFIGPFSRGQYCDALPGGTVNKSGVYHDKSSITTFKNFLFRKYLLSSVETYCSCQHIS